MELKYVETNELKKALKKWKDPNNQYYDYSQMDNAALIIPDGIVVIDFDGDNKSNDGKVYDTMIGNYLLEKHPTYYTQSQPNHFHLYYKIPNGLKLKKDADVITTGGFKVDYLTEGTLAVVKMNGKLRNDKEELSESILSKVPFLPDICYPLYGFQGDNLISLCEGDGRDNALFKHIVNIKRHYKDFDMRNSVSFINHFLFKEPLEDKITNSMIERSSDYAKGNYKNDDSFTYNESKLIKVSELEEKNARWLWYPYLAIGTISILSGDPGNGKTYIGLFIGSTLSRGEKFVHTDDSKNEITSPVNVLILNGEDSPEYTIKKRIKALNGDEDHFFIIDESNQSFNIDYVSTLENLIHDNNIKLIIIDPIQAYLPKWVNMDKASDIRSTLSPLKGIADKEQCSFLLIMHRNKNSKTSDLYRTLGSIDFVSFCRSLLAVVKDNDNNTRCIKHLKNSIGPLGDDILFDITEDGIVFLDNEERIDEKQEKYLGYKEIVETYLSNGQVVSSNEMLKISKENGIPDRMLKRIKKELNIKGLQKDKHHFWYIDQE